MATAIPARRRSVVALTQAAVLVGALVATGITPVVAQDTSAAPASAAPGASVDCVVPGEKKTYGYIVPGPDTWYQRDVDGFTFGAQADGHEVVVLNSEYDAEKEIANIESLINQGVEGISMFSSTAAGAALAAKRAKEAGIPIVVTDSVGTVIDAGEEVVAAIDFDWEGMGKAYANWMAETYPGEKFAILTGFFDSPPSQLINKGMTETAKAGLGFMRETGAGSRMAAGDLKLRGAGELPGTRQSGLPEFRLATPQFHDELLPIARDDAKLILDRDPELKAPRGQALGVLLYLFERDAAIKLLQSG